MRAYVDPNICIGCGMCVQIEPRVFQMTESGTAEAYEDTTDETKDSVQQAIQNCPVAAISEE